MNNKDQARTMDQISLESMKVDQLSRWVLYQLRQSLNRPAQLIQPKHKSRSDQYRLSVQSHIQNSTAHRNQEASHDST
ncbi:hypothetical protein F511_06612 [Dorcoceras hygrometricum]|uniref:Uncharacterized protein n=1 Tax=Dorcoceras hygrometricum TaxID=472368 RepID=A0A2Z7B6B0_9LAMI|nr:hypothetical protein F511_06612 [Dorcoceras hygrometricum]